MWLVRIKYPDGTKRLELVDSGEEVARWEMSYGNIDGVSVLSRKLSDKLAQKIQKNPQVIPKR